MPVALVVKKGSKARSRVAAIHAEACVGYLEHDVGSARGGRDRDGSAAGHGVARVEREIDEDLLDHIRVRPHEARGGCEAELQRHVATEHALERGAHALDHRVQVHALEMRLARTAEGEQLTRDRRRLPLGVLDLPDLAPQLARRRKLLENQLGIDADRAEQVVELVGDRRSEPAHDLHLVGEAQLGFETFALLHFAAQVLVGLAQCARAIGDLRLEPDRGTPRPGAGRPPAP